MSQNRYTKLDNCRICGNSELKKVVDLGEQTLTGIFPKQKDTLITSGPLQLVKCVGDDKTCGLLQLAHSYDLQEMYGLNYGYRSGLNADMVKHLESNINKVKKTVQLEDDDIVVDIGSNDCTSLKFYNNKKIRAIGIDPTGVKFSKYYPEHIRLIPDFFSAKAFKSEFAESKAKVVTSFSMFYDLESPVTFAQDIADILDNEGIWMFEQSYLPSMLEMNSYDTACHEHLEYYTLKQIQFIVDKVGMRIVDVEFNDVNGGSFSVMACHKSASYPAYDNINSLLKSEIEMGLDKLETYELFDQRIKTTKTKFLNFLNEAKAQGKSVVGLGASTKGNVLLQYCDITPELMSAVGEVNEEKFDCYTPGTLLPIIQEDKLLESKPDYLVILPWHFKEFFKNSKKFEKFELVFPLPNLEFRKSCATQ